MFIIVNRYNFWKNKSLVINTDCIKSLASMTIGNHHVNSNTHIVFKDGTSMKVVESVGEIANAKPASEMYKR